MDPQTRILIESAYEAVIDAGVNPKSLQGSRTGVYIGSCISESEKTWFYEKVPSGGFGITGCSRAMMANRISYSLGLQGPSFLLDTACSSSMYALDNAFTALRNGEIDAAIIGGSNLILHPFVTLQFARLGVLAPDGFCRPFDKNATGYTRSEAINCLFLQRKRDAKRIYAHVVYSKTNCDGYKPEGITYPSGKLQEQLLREFYLEVPVTPNDLGYLEAHSTGTVVGDPEECRAIDNVLCSQRKDPLLVGSVKSNVGHSEAASGICSLVKVCLSFESGKIPPNINFKEVKSDISALAEGRLVVVDNVKDLEKPYIGISSFGFGGANAHALLKAHDRVKVNNGLPSDDIPRLVTWAGRTEEAVNTILDALEKNPLDAEYIALLHNIQKEDVSGMIFRGFGIFSKNGDQPAQCLGRDIQHYSGIKRPTVWVFSGMGSQWSGMGAGLMILPQFRRTIEICHSTLLPKGLNLIEIITSTDPNVMNNILHSFVGIAAIQIGLVDVLRSLQLEPDYIIGHSVGELGCGYADGGFTAEQMITAAYYRGKVSLEMEKIKGSMAAVGLGYSNIIKMLPEKIEVACHNSADSCTISGPADDVAEFVAKLKANDIFAKEVPCSNIAYHSQYIAHMGPHLLKYLKTIIPHPKKRSQKWLSTSVPKTAWDQEQHQYCSAEYHTNNLLSSVLFEETFSLLPENALTIEIAPHGLLQAILKRSMPEGAHVALTQRGHKNNVVFFLNALGKLYNTGTTFPVENMYPKVQFPVSRNTPGISSLVRWDHSEDWFVTKYENMKTKASGERLFKVNMDTNDEEYMSGHVIDGKILVPATAYLQYVWETFSLMYHGPSFMDVPVEFEDVRFLRATNLTANSTIELNVMIHYGTGNFEITESGSLVVTGRIREVENPEIAEIPTIKDDSNYPVMNKRDFYKELKLRGYHYNGQFRAVEEGRGDGLYGKIKWEYNWVTFMDSMLQIKIVGIDSRTLYLPTKIAKLRINGSHHFNLISQMDPENRIFDVYVDEVNNRIVAGGVEFIGLHASPVQRRKPPGIPVLENYHFLPHFPSPNLSVSDATRTCVQVALENMLTTKLKISEVSIKDKKPLLSNFKEALEDLPLIRGDCTYLTNEKIEDMGDINIVDGKLATQTNCHIIIASPDYKENDSEISSIAEKALVESGYLLLRENLNQSQSQQTLNGFEKVAVLPLETGDEVFIIFRKVLKDPTSEYVVIEIKDTDTEFDWIVPLQTSITNKNPTVIYAQNQTFSGILGLINCLRKEPDGNFITAVFIDDTKAPPFSLEDPFYANQLKLGLAVNVYRNGAWGTYRHLQLVDIQEVGPRSDHIYGNIIQRGDLSSLRWFEGPLDPKTSQVRIVYSSLNFRDVMLMTGRLSIEYMYGSSRIHQSCAMGFEGAGYNVATGKRIMCMVEKGGVSSFLAKPSKLFWNVPDHWTLEQAATVPVVYITVYFAFFMCSDIRQGKSILIHAGTGGVGLAAIRVALAYNLEVFTTCSTQQKREFLLKTYPQLKESNIGNSRDLSFEKMIKRQTNGKGVDFVLNSLSEDKLLASIRCLGTGGRFLEIGKFDMINDTMLGMSCFLKEIKFIPVLADSLVDGSEECLQLLKHLINTDIANGIIQPLPVTVFQINELEQAFRHLIGGKHMGKVVIKVRENAESMETLPVKVLKQVYFKPNLSYIVCGGLGGFGLELVDWMVLRGASKVVLSSSRGISKSYQEFRIALWKTYNCEVVVSTKDITTLKGCQALIHEAEQLGPVGGIFNLAVLLRDGVFINQTKEKFIESLAPKAIATKYLDEVSRAHCPNLEQFVVFSSVSCGRGNAGQTNYGMANSIMERIIEDRVKNGYPGKAIQWGAVGEVGLVADMAEDKIDMEIGGTLQQRISSCLQELDPLLNSPCPIVSSMVVAEKRVGRTGNESITETVMNIMGIRDIKSISLGTTLSEMGMDSLMAVEIKQTLERDFELILTPQDLRALTFHKLQEYAKSQAKEKTEDVKTLLLGDGDNLGMQLLLRNLGDEKRCNEIVVQLESTIDALKQNATPVIIIPGLEGTAGRAWYNIGTHISFRTSLLQLHKFAAITDLTEIGASLYESVKSILQGSEKFYLVGYSYGSLIAIEVARFLEKDGYSGNLLLIDGAPHFLKKLTLAHFGDNYTDLDVYNTLFCSIVNQIFPEETTESTMLTFVALKTLEEKMAKFMEYVKKQEIYTPKYAEEMVNAMYRRIKIAADYNLNNIELLKSPITLIRPSEVSIQNIEEDYCLPNVTKGKVTLKVIAGNHTTMLDNPELPLLINNFHPITETETNFDDYIRNVK